MTTQEITTAAIRLINETITLGANVMNGCTTDYPKYKSNLDRMEGIKTWAIANEQIQTIRLYLVQHNFGMNNQFSAREISKLFHN